MKNQKQSETGILEQYQIALQNAKTQPIIADEMAELGYDTTKITEGKLLLGATIKTYNFNKQEGNETIEASAIFKKEKEALDVLYKKHRKKAKAMLRKNPELLKKLGVYKRMPNAYINKIETIRKFYTDIDQEILEKLTVVKITDQDITAGIAQVQKVAQSRAEYLREVGESEDATKQKDVAFANIALEDHPQLMEALARKRKS